ncbi:MAG: nuclear transport factor 2 family protein [Gammaproteobacteria bacterium]
MDLFKRLMLILLLVFSSITAGLAKETSATAAECIIESYLDAWVAVMKVDAGAGQLDHLMDFFHEDIVYEHPRVGAVIAGKPQVRAGLAEFIGSTRNPDIQVRRHITALDVVVVEYDRVYESRSDGRWQAQERHQLTLFELDGDRIKRIRDYW